MLGNKDFAKMLSGGGLSAKGESSFDLKKTISQWDKDQNKKETLKNKKKIAVQFKQATAGKGADKSGYRDRALERRKDINQEEAKFEEIVSKLDAEQTKFLGGDLEHTHFVKGLDFALLQKMREGAERAAAEREKAGDSEEDEEDEKSPNLADIETHSSMAENMKIFLLKNSSSAAATAAVLLPVKRKENLLPRTFYEFNVTSAAVREEAEASEEEQPLDFDPIPLTIMKSKRETSHIEEYVNHVLDNTLLKQLAALFESGKLVSSGRHKKKRKHQHPAAPDAAGSSVVLDNSKVVPTELSMLSAKLAAPSLGGSAAAPKLAASDFTSMYDDDIVVSKYVPVGALDENPVGAPTAAASSSSSSSLSLSSTLAAGTGATVKGLFDKKGAVDTRPVTVDSSQLLKPVNDILRAQAAKEKAARERQFSTETKPATKEILVGKDEKGQQLVHRDVFASTKDKVVAATTNLDGSKMGDAFGLKGTYDLFPENSGDYDMMDSDEEGGDETDPKKARFALPAEENDDEEGGAGRSFGNNRKLDASSKYVDSGYMNIKSQSGKGGGLNLSDGGGTIRKSIIKNSTPWNRAGAGAGDAGGGGSNRAARRAALKKG